MLTLGAFGGLAVLSSGGSAAKKTQGPPINAQSPDEETFIKYVYTSKVALRSFTVRFSSLGKL